MEKGGVKSLKRNPTAFDSIDFTCLSMASLQNYAKVFHLTIPDSAMHNEVAEIIKSHFANICVNEDQVINSFVHRIDEIGKHKEITSSPASIGEHRRIKKPKKYGDDYSLERILARNAEEDAQKEEQKAMERVTEDTTQYCTCNMPSNDEMIACDNENCRIKWYHYKCVNIDPQMLPEKWYCPECIQLGYHACCVCSNRKL